MPVLHFERAFVKAKPRDLIWAAIRKLQTDFDASDIRGETGLNLDTIRDYLHCLVAAHYLERSGHRTRELGRPSVPIYRLVHDSGIDAPRLREDGTVVTSGQRQEALWRTLKILPNFNIRELAAAASTEDCVIDVTYAKEYMTYLFRAGYLALLQAAKPGKLLARYRFVGTLNTGPKPPIIRRQLQKIRQIYDPNIDRVMWQSSPYDLELENDHG